jgi:hypothetical protein
VIEFNINPENKDMGDILLSLQRDMPEVKIVDTYPTSITVRVKGIATLNFINYMNENGILYNFKRLVGDDDDTREVSSDR